MYSNMLMCSFSIGRVGCVLMNVALLALDNGGRAVKCYWKHWAIVIVDGHRRRWQEFVGTKDRQPSDTADTRTA